MTRAGEDHLPCKHNKCPVSIYWFTNDGHDGHPCDECDL